MVIPFLHPFHATTGGDHLFLWAVAGAGLGLAVVIGREILRGFFERDEDANDEQPPAP
ncbi:MAG: hypothetical protein AB7T37_05025 [Dehalococcoidia bacterium]